jgi:hypothetical protein
VTPETILARVKAYEGELNVLLPLLICGAFWAKLLYGNVRTDQGNREEPIFSAIYGADILDPDIQKRLPGYERHHTPMNNHRFKALREPLREYIPDDGRYEAKIPNTRRPFGVEVSTPPQSFNVQIAPTSPPLFPTRSGFGALILPRASQRSKVARLTPMRSATCSVEIGLIVRG